MTTINAFVKSHPLLSYFTLAFAISWGGLLIVAGPGGLLGTKEVSEVLFPIVVLATLAGPSVAGILLTGLVYGKAGFRDLLFRLLRWRVGVRWYAVSLLTAPLTMLAVLLALSLVSPAFRPLLFVVDDPLGLLVFSVVAGLMIGIFEELGWMGFAVPSLLGRRYGVLGTGLIIGLLWGARHFPPTREATLPLERSRWPSCCPHSSSRGSRPTGCSWCGSTSAPMGACRWRCSCLPASSWPTISSATR